MSNDYHEDVKKRNTLLLRKKLDALPFFLRDYFYSLNDVTSTRTRLGYAHDLRIFFDFLITELPRFYEKTVAEITPDDMKSITAAELQRFMNYVEYYLRGENEDTGASPHEQKVITNAERGKQRKLAAVRSLFSYLYKTNILDSDQSVKVDFPKLHEKNIVRLEPNEVANLLDAVESGDMLASREKKYHERTALRDLALITLLLGTGMRISECVGINLSHLDLENNCVKIIRKGGDESLLYFGDEIRNALLDYLELRKPAKTVEGHEDALFLSLQNKRLCDRAIQKLVKKYSKTVTPLKKITPHKLRSTFATNLYNETGDIYLVADVLGHADVNTTRKHYAAMSEERRRSAAKHVKLRKE